MAAEGACAEAVAVVATTAVPYGLLALRSSAGIAFLGFLTSFHVVCERTCDWWDSNKALTRLHRKLTKRGSEPREDIRYGGTWVKLSDGTRIGLRRTSKSGGRTIDVFTPDGKYIKVHIE